MSDAEQAAQKSGTQAPKKSNKKSLVIDLEGGGDSPPKSDKKRVPKSQRVKRGPARPLRRVPKEVLDSRIEKLEKRLKRTTSQMEDASRHYAAYIRERDFRKDESLQVGA